MKVFEFVFLSLLIVGLSGFAAGCSSGYGDRSAAFYQQQVMPGTYASNRCFLNKLATQASTSGQRFSRATLTFNADGTGASNWRIFSDITCATLTATEIVTFSSVSVIPVAGVNVLRLQESGTVITPTLWIPFGLSSGGYLLDVDFTDGESGPYLTEPSAANVQSFGANPAQGVSFDQQ